MNVYVRIFCQSHIIVRRLRYVTPACLTLVRRTMEHFLLKCRRPWNMNFRV